MKRCCIFVLSLFLVTLTACSSITVVDSICQSKKSDDEDLLMDDVGISTEPDNIDCIEDIGSDAEITDGKLRWKLKDGSFNLGLNVSDLCSDTMEVQELGYSDGKYSYKIISKHVANFIGSFDAEGYCEIYVLDDFIAMNSELFEKKVDYLNGTPVPYVDCMNFRLRDVDFDIINSRPCIYWRDSNNGVWDVHYIMAINSDLCNENVKYLYLDMQMPDTESDWKERQEKEMLTPVGYSILKHLDLGDSAEFVGITGHEDTSARSYYFGFCTGSDSVREAILFDSRSEHNLYIVCNNLKLDTYIRDFHSAKMYATFNPAICFTVDPWNEFSSLDLKNQSYQTITVGKVNYSYCAVDGNLIFISDPFEDCYLVVSLHCNFDIDSYNIDALVEDASEYLINFKVYDGNTLVVEN